MSGHVGDETNLLPLLVIEPRYLDDNIKSNFTEF